MFATVMHTVMQVRMSASYRSEYVDVAASQCGRRNLQRTANLGRDTNAMEDAHAHAHAHVHVAFSRLNRSFVADMCTERCSSVV